MARSIIATLAGISAVVVVGLLAGLYVGTGLAQYSNAATPYEIWIPRQQAEVGLFKNFMPSFGYAATALPALAALFSTGVRRWLFAAAALFILGTLISTELGEIPLNGMVLGWDAHHPVANWEAMRVSWLHFHWIKTTFAVLALLVSSIGLAGGQIGAATRA